MDTALKSLNDAGKLPNLNRAKDMLCIHRLALTEKSLCESEAYSVLLYIISLRHQAPGRRFM